MLQTMEGQRGDASNLRHGIRSPDVDSAEERLCSHSRSGIWPTPPSEDPVSIHAERSDDGIQLTLTPRPDDVWIAILSQLSF